VNRPGTIPAAVGKGLAAGLAGTAAMTMSSTLEAWIRERGASNAPAEALRGLLHVEPADETGEQRLAFAGHWGYGTSLGVWRGLLGTLGLRGAAATAAHLGVIWGMAQAVLPATAASTPFWKWAPVEVAIDLWHHAVYAVAAGLAYEWLDRP
jgi:hypothetical protein